MKMQLANSVTLRSSIVAAGNLSSRVLVGLDAKATWKELLDGSILEGPTSDLLGQSVLVATTDQFRAAAALIELDGIARRIVLFPPDVSRENLPYVASTAESDMLVTDRPEIASMDHGVGRVILCKSTVTPDKITAPETVDRGSQIETEWILLTSGTTGLPKLAIHTLASLAG